MNGRIVRRNYLATDGLLCSLPLNKETFAVDNYQSEDACRKHLMILYEMLL